MTENYAWFSPDAKHISTSIKTKGETKAGSEVCNNNYRHKPKHNLRFSTETEAILKEIPPALSLKPFK